MKNSQLFLLKVTLLFLFTSLIMPNHALADGKLKEIIVGKHRSDNNINRNAFRHPVETLAFFGIEPNMNVVEISPGGGWYTEILAPYLKQQGQYTAAGYDPDSKIKYFSTNAKKFADKLATDPKHYSKVNLTIMQAPDKLDFAEKNSADLVLSFRNTHNWASQGQARSVFTAIFQVLKPGGIFGLVQHRADENTRIDTSGKLGYLKQSNVIAMAKNAGFKLVDQSEINANAKDTKDYEQGVWSLPPVYRMGKKNKKQLKAIGESDRMTLKFIKPLTD